MTSNLRAAGQHHCMAATRSSSGLHVEGQRHTAHVRTGAEVPHPALARQAIAVVRQPVVAAIRNSDRLDAALLRLQSRLFTVERVRVHQEVSRPTHHVGRAQASHRRRPPAEPGGPRLPQRPHHRQTRWAPTIRHPRTVARADRRRKRRGQAPRADPAPGSTSKTHSRQSKVDRTPKGMQTNLSRWRLTMRPARASPRPPSKSSAFQPQ
jgi:hypothetical protein